MMRTVRNAAARLRPPKLSIVVVVYDMALQARNTIRSLLPDYQCGASPADYEVVIVENRSRSLLDPGFIAGLPGNFRYLLREESAPTPVPAINEGVRRSRGANICVMIDGARLLTPGIVCGLLGGHRLHDNAIVAVPGYHLGSELQQLAVASGYDAEQDQQLLASIDWPRGGYRLFDIACLSGSCAGGFYLPISESNCLSMPRRVWEELGGMDLRFDLRGGGMVNLDLYKRACEHPGVQHVMLPGEGTFHQFHGGVTTGGEAPEDRERFINEIKAQYRRLRGRHYASPRTSPVFLGELSPNVHRFLHFSATRLAAASGQAPGREATVLVHDTARRQPQGVGR
jgi:hypothetical protein